MKISENHSTKIPILFNFLFAMESNEYRFMATLNVVHSAKHLVILRSEVCSQRHMILS